jgi:hypothetical protein
VHDQAERAGGRGGGREGKLSEVGDRLLGGRGEERPLDVVKGFGQGEAQQRGVDGLNRPDDGDGGAGVQRQDAGQTALLGGYGQGPLRQVHEEADGGQERRDDDGLEQLPAEGADGGRGLPVAVHVAHFCLLPRTVV